MASKVTIHEYNTPNDLYATLARVFGEHENNGSRWVRLNVDDVELTFFMDTRPAYESAPA